MSLVVSKRLGYAILIVVLVQLVLTAVAIYFGYQADRRICPVIEVLDVPLSEERKAQLTENQKLFRVRLHEYNETLCD